jgi:hypothetical protein
MRAVLQEVPRKAVIRDVKRKVVEKELEERSQHTRDDFVVNLLKDVKQQGTSRASKREKEREEMNQFQTSMSELMEDVKHTGPSRLSRRSGGGKDMIQGRRSSDAIKSPRPSSTRESLSSVKESQQAQDDSIKGHRSRSPRAGLPAGSPGPSKWDGLRVGNTFIKATQAQAVESQKRRGSNRSASPHTNSVDSDDFLNDNKNNVDEQKQRTSQRSGSPALSERKQVPSSPAASKWNALKMTSERMRETAGSPYMPSKWDGIRVSADFIREAKVRVSRSKRELLANKDNDTSQDIEFVPEDHPTSPTRAPDTCVAVFPKLTPMQISGTKVTAIPVDQLAAPINDQETVNNESTVTPFSNRTVSAATDAGVAGIASKGKWSGLNRLLKDTLTSTSSTTPEQPTAAEVDFMPDPFESQPRPKADADGCVKVQPKITPVVLTGQRSKWEGVRGSVDFVNATKKQLSNRKLNHQEKQLSSRSLNINEQPHSQRSLEVQDQQASSRSLNLQETPTSDRSLKPNSDRSLKDSKRPSNWKKIKHVFTFVNETKNATDRRNNDEDDENDTPRGYDMVGSGSVAFQLTDSMHQKYEASVLEKVNETKVIGPEFHPPQFHVEAYFGEEPKQSKWASFSDLVKANKEPFVSTNDTADQDGCVQAASKMAPVVLNSQGQTGVSPRVDNAAFDFPKQMPSTTAETTKDSGVDGLVRVRPKMKAVVIKSQQQSQHVPVPTPANRNEKGLIQVQPRITPVVLKSQQQASSFPADAFQNMQQNNAFDETSTDAQTSKWGGVRASSDFINWTKRKAKSKDHRAEKGRTESTPTAPEETKPKSKWADFKGTLDKQSEKSPAVSPSGIAEETEIKFIPESSQWDSVKQANDLIEDKKKRRAASRARQQDLEKSAHSTPSAALSISSRGSSDKELSGLSDELQLAPSTDTEATISKPSKWDLMKSASASTTGSAPMESIVEDKAAAAETAAAAIREERKKKRRSKLDGVKMGVEVVNKTKKPADESKGSKAGEGAVISSDNNKVGDREMKKASKKGDKKANKVTVAEASVHSNNKEISLPGKAGYEADTTFVAPVVQIGTAAKNVAKPSASKVGEEEAPQKEKRVSRWRAMKRGMDFVKTTKQEVEAGKTDKAVKTTETTTATATTPPAANSEAKVKRSMWDTLKPQADLKFVPPPPKAADAMSPADVRALEKEQRRAAREAKRADKKTSRWTGLKSGMDFIAKTKKQTDDKKANK